MGKTNKGLARLKQEADIERVVDHLHLDTFPKGSAIFIHCPNPLHNDVHPTNCYFKSGWNNAICLGCGQRFNAIDLIMDVTGCDFGEAADELWEISGRPDWYRDNDRKGKKRKEKKPEFSISGDECKIIGLKLPNKISIPKEQSYEKLTGYKDMIDIVKDDNNIYVGCDIEYVQPTDFIDDISVLALEMAKEKKEMYGSQLQFHEAIVKAVPECVESQIAINAAKEAIRVCDEIIKRATEFQKSAA